MFCFHILIADDDLILWQQASDIANGKTTIAAILSDQSAAADVDSSKLQAECSQSDKEEDYTTRRPNRKRKQSVLEETLMEATAQGRSSPITIIPLTPHQSAVNYTSGSVLQSCSYSNNAAVGYGYHWNADSTPLNVSVFNGF